MMRYIIFGFFILFLLGSLFWLQQAPSPLQVNSGKTTTKGTQNENSYFLTSKVADNSSAFVKNKSDPKLSKEQNLEVFSETEFAVEEQLHQQILTGEEKQEHEKERQQRAQLELESQMRKLMDSGEGGEHWLPQLNTLHENWERMSVELGVSVEISPWDCFSGGCASTVTYDQYEDINKLWNQINRSLDSEMWQGNTFLSGAIEMSFGDMQATWVLTPPISFNEN